MRGHRVVARVGGDRATAASDAGEAGIGGHHPCDCFVGCACAVPSRPKDDTRLLRVEARVSEGMRGV